jgi:hypothetical protein
MAYSYTEVVADGNTYVFAVGVPYINKEHIHVYEDDVETTAYSWLTDSTIQFSTKPTSGTVVKIQRITPKDRRIVTFQDPSVLKQSTLNLNSNNLFYIFQELKDQLDDTFAALDVLTDVIELGPASLGANEFVGNQSITGDVSIDGGLDMNGNVIGDAILQGVTLQNYTESRTALGSVSGSVVIDLTQITTITATISGETTFSFSNASGTHSVLLVLSDGGSYTVNWPSNIYWPEGNVPSLTTAVDIVSLLTVDGGTTWYGVLAMDSLALPA